jgi:hypothetical protein
MDNGSMLKDSLKYAKVIGGRVLEVAESDNERSRLQRANGSKDLFALCTVPSTSRKGFIQ